MKIEDIVDSKPYTYVTNVSPLELSVATGEEVKSYLESSKGTPWYDKVLETMIEGIHDLPTGPRITNLLLALVGHERSFDTLLRDAKASIIKALGNPENWRGIENGRLAFRCEMDIPTTKGYRHLLTQALYQWLTDNSYVRVSIIASDLDQEPAPNGTKVKHKVQFAVPAPKTVVNLGGAQ